jgi:hypothetical protein
MQTLNIKLYFEYNIFLITNIVIGLFQELFCNNIFSLNTMFGWLYY